MATSSEFVAELEGLIESRMSALGEVRESDAAASCAKPLDEVTRRLKVALKNELEASELAAIWMPSTPEIDVKLGLARQSGDEAQHYRLILDHLQALGVELDGFNPVEGGYSPMFQLLRGYTSTVERVAAAQLTRESLALTKNEQFIEFCDAVGATGTAEFYRNEIQPDEQWHVRLGRRTLEKYAVTSELQTAALAASTAVLDLAERIQYKQVHELGISHAPGC